MLCTHFGISRSGYYSWKEYSKILNSKKAFLKVSIQEEFSKSNGTYGSPRIYHCLKERSIFCSKNTVAKIMKENGIRVHPKKSFIPKTTTSNHDSPISPRIFKSERDFPNGPNKIWVGDITYLPIGSKFLYLSVVLDLFNRAVIGWSVDNTLEAKGVVQALQNAIISQKSDARIIFHSDRGSQYASKKFRDLLNNNEMIPSMSRKGNCYDNCYVESFFKTLKTDLKIMGTVFTEDNIRYNLFRYIEIWYNRKRKHSSLGYVAPINFK